MKDRSHLRVRKAVFDKRSGRITADFRPGMHAVVNPSHNSAQSFLECASGLRAPLWGSVRLNNKKPFKTPPLRARIGSLFPEEPPFEKNETVARYVERIARLRGTSHAQSEAELPLAEALLPRNLTSLTSKERRRLALALALTIDEPVGLFLYEPLDSLASSEVSFVLQRLEQHAEKERVVIAVCANHRTALRLSRRVQSWGGVANSRTTSAAYSILCADPPRLAQAFLGQDEVLEVRFNPAHSNELIVMVTEEEEGAQALTRCLAKGLSPVLQLTRLTRAETPAQFVAPDLTLPTDEELEEGLPKSEPPSNHEESAKS